MDNNELGKIGEQLAIKHLRSKGYEILDCNWRFGRIELDIIARYENHIVVIEVKTRGNAYAGEPWEFVGKSKQKRIIKAADEYMRGKNIDVACRFDVISIIYNSKYNKLEHIEDAFYPLV